MMPYVSNADREHALWVTLREAVEHIEEVEHCSFRAAWDQLRAAIGDQAVMVRWGDVSLELSTIHDGHYIVDDDVPPNNKWFWKSARAIFVGTGCLLDDPACRAKNTRLKLIREGTLRYRPVLIQREAVERIWPIANETAEPQRPTTDQIGDAEESPSDSDNSHGPFRFAKDEKVCQLVREMYADPANVRPNLNEAWDLLKGKLEPLGVTRERLHPILKKAEFADQRNKRGQRKRKK
jgi:hypothetical protein